MERNRAEFAEFYTSARDDCLRIVTVSVGDRQLAADLASDSVPVSCSPTGPRT
ncbi:MAG TPA: hypothetical protein VHY58_14170 [Streptosporangiaceae bacterium]|nr:hypothetical protein [Streptosporangiaceae bacterium]